ncbi:hypothetical protein BH09ACT5_BH09ACT5_11410 [soil metagenome]
MQWQSPAAAAAEALFARTVAEAQAAAIDDPTPTPEPTETPTPDPTPTGPPAPPAVALGTITPGESSTVSAPEVGATVDFSGHKVDAPLDVAVSGLPDAAAFVVAETSSVVLTQPFEVTATTADGDDVTSFPADPTFEDPDAVQPVLVDVTPGVELSIAVSADQLAAVDPTTVRIVTRESDRDPWVELPSFYDAATGAAVAQSDHLSQFAVIGTPFVPPGPRIVLDPDDDVGFTSGPNGSSTELGYNVRLANALAAQLKSLCGAKVLVTRTSTDQPYLSRDFRAAQAAAWNPDVTVTVAFNTVYGYAWGGDESEGGTLAWGRGSAADTALRDSLIATMPGYTTRPAHVGTDPPYPWAEFTTVPGAMVHLETLYFDNTDDRGVMDSPGGWESITSGVATGIGMYAETLGFDCTDPATGGWPAKPSAAQIAQWKQLGYHYHQVYGGDPVSLSTGNLVEDEPLFTLNGPGTQAVDLTLVYNSQDGRASRVGAGWSFGLGARAQRFDDGSVLIVHGDGASDVFNPSNTGGFTADPDVHDTLTDTGSGRLALTSPRGEKWVFDASDIDGIGELVSYTDVQGNGYTLAYGDPSTVTDPAGDPFSADRFLPLTSITDAAGQTITVTTDGMGRITGFTHPDGRTWTLGYSASGDLTTITNPDGRVRTFTYDTGHRMLTATDSTGVKYLVNQYDAQGRVVKQWDADQNLRTFTYTGTAAAGGSTVYTNNEGQDTTYVWDDHSRITSITDPLGGVESFVYDADGNTTAHTDQLGNTTTYEYDDTGNLTKETTPDGSISSYTYTSTGVLASVTDQGGPGNTSRTTSYDIDARGLTTAAHLPDGSVVSFTYTPTGDLASVTDQAGNTTAYGYDSVGNLVSVTDPLGQVTTTAYDGAGRATSTTDPTGASTTFVWDAADRLTQSIDALGGVTSYGYDANDHVISVTDPLGATTGFTWDPMFHLTAVTAPDGGVTRYTYDAEDNLTSVTDPLGATTTLTLDALGRPTSVTDAAGAVWKSAYDALGQVTAATDPLGAVTKYVYDVMGRPTEVTDPTGAVTRAAYDSAGHLAATTDAAGGTTTYAYTALDQLAAVTDQIGQTTTYRYDSVGNQTATIDRRGQTWATSYDALGRTTSTTDPTGATTTYAYDLAARTVTTTDPLGHTTTTTLDALGRATSVTDPLGAVTSAVYDAAGRLTQTTDANGATSTAAYDPAGRFTALTNALGAVSTFAYDYNGQVVKTTNPLGVATAYRYDPLGRLTQVTDGYHPLPTTATGTDVNVMTKYTYTVTGLLASIIDPAGASTTFDHDERGLTTAETNPLGITTRTNYDSLGRTTSTTDGTGATTNYSYTPRSDVSTIAYPDGVRVGFEYDADQNPIIMTDSLGATGWAYDRAGRMVSQTDPNGATLGWSYNRAGQLATLAVPGGNIGYNYDPAGRVTSQSSPWGSLDYSYDPVGNLLTEARSSGITTTNTYDAAGQVTSISHQTPWLPDPSQSTSTVAAWDGSFALPGDVASCPTGTGTNPDRATTAQVATYLDSRAATDTTIAGCEKTAAYASGRGLPTPAEVFAAGDALTYTYSYDKAGNVTSETEDRGTYGAVATRFSYDDLSRLTRSTTTDGVTNTYQYDRVGNRTGWITNNAPDTGTPLAVTSTFNKAGQLLSEDRSRPDGVTAVDYRYNAAGQRTSQTAYGPDETATLTYTYNGAGRLATTAQGGDTTTYGYDGLGRNLTTETDWADTTNVWAGTSVVQQSSTVGGTSTLLRDALGQVALQSRTPGDTTAAPAWNLHDRLGSTVAQANRSGRITDLTTYSDFGIPTFDSTGFASTTGYTGELTDPTPGQNSYFSRTYDPYAATWLTPDTYRGTLTNPQSQHRYGYVEGNPTTWTDHLGFSVLDDYAYNKRRAGSDLNQRRTADNWERYYTKNPNAPAPTLPKVHTPSDNTETPTRHENLFGWSDDIWQNIGATAAGIAVGVVGAVALAACIAATVGICAGVAGGIAVGVLGGAAIGATSAGVTYALQSGKKTPQGWGESLGWGAAFGGLTGGIAPAAASVLRAGQVAATQQAVRTGITTASAGAGSAATAGMGTQAIKASDLTFSATVANHALEGSSGVKARPYGTSQLTIQEIINAQSPIADPGGIPGGLRWDAPGELNGSPGMWELVVDPSKGQVVHYLFDGRKK